MKIISQKRGFECDHSSVNYEFISEEKISDEAKEFARKSSHRFTVGRNKLKITIPGEHYLYDHIQNTLLEKYNIPLLVYEDYDWWNFILMFDYNDKFMENLKKYEAGDEHTVHVSKKGKKIELWITIHIDYGSFEDESPFEELGDLFLDIRNDILKDNFKSLEILKKYCDEGELPDSKPSSKLYDRLTSILDIHWG